MGDWKLKRLIIEIVTGLLIIGGAFAGVAAGIAFWQHSDDHRWYTAVLAILVGLGTCLASWLVAALFSLVVEMADNLQAIRASPGGPPQVSSDDAWFVTASTAAELAGARNGQNGATPKPVFQSLGIRKAMDVPVGAGILLTDSTGAPQIQRVDSIDLWDGEAGHLKFTIAGNAPIHLRYDDQVISSL